MNERYLQAAEHYKAQVEAALAGLLPETAQDTEDGAIPALQCASMRYSLLAGGKRIRPVLLLAVVDMLHGDSEEALCTAAALEMIHTYSLIHDDLPGMDNDDYRRGRLTSHKVYGEGQAILAGDGLLNFAYECMIRDALRYPEHLANHVRAMQHIAVRAGVTGMIAGQCIDLQCTHIEPDKHHLSYINRHKTADLLTAPLLAGAELCGADAEVLSALAGFGEKIGIAFQMDDDLLDVVGDAAVLGKNTGMDAKMGKLTWPAMYGIEQTKQMATNLWQEAQTCLQPFGEDAWFLSAFAEALSSRKM